MSETVSSYLEKRLRTEDEARSDISKLMLNIARPRTIKPVFSTYIAHRIKRALLNATTGITGPDRDFPGADIGDMETIGDCRYC
jgi:hypothetical protein